MKKITKVSLLSLLTIGALNAIAGDYISLGYGSGSISYSDSADFDYAGQQISYYKIDKDYIINAGIAKIKAETTYDDSGEIYDYEMTSTGFGIGGNYKIIKNNGIFVAPGISYFKLNEGDYDFTRQSDGYTLSGTTESDADLSVDIMIGYDYAEDSFAYMNYCLDDDILESEDEDYNTLSLGIVHKVNDKINLSFSYNTDMSNPDGQESSSGYSIGIGYQFK